MDATTPGSLLSDRPLTELGTTPLLRRLWREHLRRHLGRVVIVLVLTALMAGLTALYPVIIDHAFSMFAAKDRRILYQVPALVVVITSLKAATTYGQTVLTQNLVLKTIRELQSRMFAHLTMADLARVEREAPAQLAARFTTDAATIREAMTRAVGGIANAITVIGLIASMLWLDWVLCLIAAALYPLAALPIQKIGKRVRRASGGMQERMGETATMLTESFTQARTVRAYRLEQVETARADRAFGQLNRALMRMTRTRSGVDPMLEVLGGAAVAAVMGFAGWRAAVGSSTVGNFTGFVAALLIASQPLRALGSLNAAVQEGVAGLVRVTFSEHAQGAPSELAAWRKQAHEAQLAHRGCTGPEVLVLAVVPPVRANVTAYLQWLPKAAEVKRIVGIARLLRDRSQAGIEPTRIRIATQPCDLTGAHRWRQFAASYGAAGLRLQLGET